MFRVVAGSRKKKAVMAAAVEVERVSVLGPTQGMLVRVPGQTEREKEAKSGREARKAHTSWVWVGGGIGSGLSESS